MSDKETAVITATLVWPSLDKKNKLSGKYGVDLSNLDDTAVAKLKTLGVKCRFDDHKDDEKPDRETFITAKSNYPIKVVFKDGVEEVEPGIIGNGTMARVKVHSYAWKSPQGERGVSLGITKLQVTKLEVYEEDDSAFDEDDSDFDEPDADAAGDFED